MRKSAWVSTPRIYKNSTYEKAIDDLNKMGIEELYPIVFSGGAYYPSDHSPQAEGFEGKDIVTPLVKEAKKHAMKVYPWIVSLNFPHKEYASKNKNLYVVNKLGISCVDDPPYVERYKWLCPSNEENKERLANIFLEVAQKFDADGLHFDYIRLPDVILPSGIRGKYEGVPQEEEILPRFDFCYCDVCRSKFKKDFGMDPVNFDYIEPGYGRWFKWRVDRITEVVGYVYGEVKKYDSSLEVSAAVFATPELSYRYVFQDWPNWGIDLYNPMIYHKYYLQDHRWIGKAVREGALKAVDVSAGVSIGFFERKEDMIEAFQLAKNNGAVGITLFVYPPPRTELINWAKEALKSIL